MRTFRFFHWPTALRFPIQRQRSLPKHLAFLPSLSPERQSTVRLDVERLDCRALPGSILAALGAELASLLALPPAIHLLVAQREPCAELEMAPPAGDNPGLAELRFLDATAEAAYWTNSQRLDCWTPPASAPGENADDEDADIVSVAAATESAPSEPAATNSLDQVFTESLETVPWIANQLAHNDLGETFVTTSDQPATDSMQGLEDFASGGAGRGGLGNDLLLASPSDSLGIVFQQSAPDAGGTLGGFSVPEGLPVDQGLQLAQLAGFSQGGEEASVRIPGSGGYSTLLTVTVFIDTPTTGSHVAGGGKFTTFGFVSPTNATMTAWVTDNGTTYNGKKIFVIPHNPTYQWGFSFTGIPTGHAVSLTVHAESQGDSGEVSITITCDA